MEVAKIHLVIKSVRQMSCSIVCSPSILKCSYQMQLLGLWRSTRPRILPVPFFGTGKNVYQRPSEVSGGSSSTEPIFR